MQIAKSWNGVAAIAKQLQRNSLYKKNWHLRWSPVCASTEVALSKWLKDQPLHVKSPRAFFSRRQNFGKGQYGRKWESSKGGVWMSAAFDFPEANKSTCLFGLGIAISLSKVLEKKGLDIRVKWPNDLLLKNRKIVGILPRLVHRGSELMFARAGIGLNVCNRTPYEGIALIDELKINLCDPVNWSAEIILALDDFISNKRYTPDYICMEVEKRLWSNYFLDPITNDKWEIEGIEFDGSLKLKRGKFRKLLSR